MDADSLAGFGSYTHVGTLLPAMNNSLQFIGFTSEQSFSRIIFLGQGCCRNTFAIDSRRRVPGRAALPSRRTSAAPRCRRPTE